MIKVISILQSDGGILSFSINLEGEYGGIKISWSQGNLNGEVHAEDYFAGLIQVREIFSKKNIVVLCNGARYDVYPSRMSRQMSKGIKAYALTLGRQTSQADLVDIFGLADLNKIGTPQQQKDYYEKWLNSLV